MATRHPPPLRIAVVGHFQAGKSTLLNCLLRRPYAKCGESTWSTTVRSKSYPVQNQHLILIDTPGVNAEEAHTKEMRQSLGQADAAILVVKGTSAMNDTLIHEIIAPIATSSLPLFVVINTWDDQSWNDGDPLYIKKNILSTIRSQIQQRLTPIDIISVNIEWAAAARGCLEDAHRRETLLSRINNDALLLEQRSRINILEGMLFQNSPGTPLFSKLECAVLISKYLKYRRSQYEIF